MRQIPKREPKRTKTYTKRRRRLAPETRQDKEEGRKETGRNAETGLLTTTVLAAESSSDIQGKPLREQAAMGVGLKPGGEILQRLHVTAFRRGQFPKRKSEMKEKLIGLLSAFLKGLEHLNALLERARTPKRYGLRMDEAMGPERLRVGLELLNDPGSSLRDVQDELPIVFGHSVEQGK